MVYSFQNEGVIRNNRPDILLLNYKLHLLMLDRVVKSIVADYVVINITDYFSKIAI
jgi:hypothetical protein